MQCSKPHRELLLIIFVRIILSVPHVSVPTTISNLEKKYTLRLINKTHLSFGLTVSYYS